MFAVIYRCYVKPGLEEVYQKSWKTVASYFVKERGALGSTLHKSDDGLWIAYSRWKSREARDASWPQENETINDIFPSEIKDAIVQLKACLDGERALPEICMEIKDDVASSRYPVDDTQIYFK